MEIRFLGRFMPRLSRNTSERPKTSSKPWLNPITNDAWEVPQVDRRVAARAAQHLSHRCSQTAIDEPTFPNAEIPQNLPSNVSAVVDLDAYSADTISNH